MRYEGIGEGRGNVRYMSLDVVSKLNYITLRGLRVTVHGSVTIRVLHKCLAVNSRNVKPQSFSSAETLAQFRIRRH